MSRIIKNIKNRFKILFFSIKYFFKPIADDQLHITGEIINRDGTVTLHMVMGDWLIHDIQKIYGFDADISEVIKGAIVHAYESIKDGDEWWVGKELEKE